MCVNVCVRIWVCVCVSMSTCVLCVCVCVLCACASIGAWVCVYVCFCVHECGQECRCSQSGCLVFVVNVCMCLRTSVCVRVHVRARVRKHFAIKDLVERWLLYMMMIAFITINSGLIPLIEGICAQILYFRFEIIGSLRSHLLLCFSGRKNMFKKQAVSPRSRSPTLNEETAHTWAHMHIL